MSALLAFVSVPPSRLHGALLFLTEPFAHHLIHRRLYEPCGNRLAIAIALAIIWNEVAVIGDVGAEFLHGFEELLELRIGLLKVVDERLEVLDFVEGLVKIPVPQRPLEPLNLVAYLLTKRLITVHQPSGVLV